MAPLPLREARLRQPAAALALVFASAAFAGGAQSAATGQRIEPSEGLEPGTALALPLLLDFDVSRDGRRAIAAVAIGNRSNLFLTAPGARPGRLTDGRRWDTAPRFLGEGLSVVFVSGRRPRGDEAEAGRLFRLVPGSEPEALTPPDLLVRSPAPSPDGSRIAFLAWRPDPETRTRRPPGAAPEGPPTGYDLWLLDVGAEEPVRWSRQPEDEGPPVWSPDGSHIALTAFDPESGRSGLLVIEATGDPPVEPRFVVTDGAGEAQGAPSWTPDGAGIAWAATAGCASDCPGPGYDAIHFTDLRAEANPYVLLGGDPGSGDFSEPRFAPAAGDDLEIAWIAADRGSRRIHRTRLTQGGDGRWAPAGRIRVMTRGSGIHEGLRWAADGSRVFSVYEAAAFPRDVWSFPTTGGRERVSETLFPEIDVRTFSRPERVESQAPGGPVVDSLLYRPTESARGGGDGGPPDAPLLVHLRGAPGAGWRSDWRNGFDPLVQLLARQGYAVLAPDLRGAGGRGAAFRAANHGDWGGADLDDLIAAVEAAAALPGIGPDLPCLLGIGYGGFLTLAALARHADRFGCGIEALGTADFERLHRILEPGRRAELERGLGPLRGNLERYRRLSLIGEGAAIRAPLVSFHGEDIPEAPFRAKEEFLAELRARPDYPLVELHFRGDMGRALLRWETDRGAVHAFLTRTLEFLSLHFPVG